MVESVNVNQGLLQIAVDRPAERRLSIDVPTPDAKKVSVLHHQGPKLTLEVKARPHQVLLGRQV
ncbi:MAG: hypothetical protein GY696_15055 [Gammaproteobacteria bacterium]|nr:hypothetical protein [Gammaproteobacteria bacterium]